MRWPSKRSDKPRSTAPGNVSLIEWARILRAVGRGPRTGHRNPRFVIGKLYSVAGYRLAPGEYRTLIVSATADAPGAYLVGPVTVHARVPGLFDAWLGEVPIEETYRQYGVLCPGVSDDTCHAAIDKALQSS